MGRLEGWPSPLPRMGGRVGSARCFHRPIKKIKKQGKTGATHEKARVEVETRGVALPTPQDGWSGGVG